MKNFNFKAKNATNFSTEFSNFRSLFNKASRSQQSLHYFLKNSVNVKEIKKPRGNILRVWTLNHLDLIFRGNCPNFTDQHNFPI